MTTKLARLAALALLCAPHDEYQGHSGTYVVGADGKRSPATPDSNGNVRIGEQVLHRPQTRPHPEGDAPRDAGGKRVDRDAAHEAAARPQPAMPEPAATPPWATPASDEAPAATETTRRARRAGQSEEAK